MGIRLAHNLIRSNVMDFIELSPDYSIYEIVATAHFINHTIGELNLRAKYGINVMAVKKRGEHIIVAPGADDIIEEKDILVIVASKKALSKLPE